MQIEKKIRESARGREWLTEECFGTINAVVTGLSCGCFYFDISETMLTTEFRGTHHQTHIPAGHLGRGFWVHAIENIEKASPKSSANDTWLGHITDMIVSLMVSDGVCDALLLAVMAETPDDVAPLQHFLANSAVRAGYLHGCSTPIEMSCLRFCLLVWFETKFLQLHGWRSVEDEIRSHIWTQQLGCLVTVDVKWVRLKG